MRILKLTLLLLFISFLGLNCKNTVRERSGESIGGHFLPDSNKVLTTIAFGSCSRQNLDQSYWEVIAARQPDLFIWLGDIVYADTEDMNKLKGEYDRLKNNNFYRDFISKIPVTGSWDDHDYGVNDGGASYRKKKQSRDLFLDFMDISKNDPVRKRKGIYRSYTFGEGFQKVKIYILDTRYFRSDLVRNENPPPNYKPDMQGTILGKEQWKWLEDEISSSTAAINIFVSSIQLIPDDHRFEKWGNFPNERKRFLDMLEQYQVKNPLILSGDRHLAEISSYKYINSEDRVVEVSSSGLTHSYEGVEETNAYRIGDLYDGKNFGILNISWFGTKLGCRLIVNDIEGKPVLNYDFIGDY